jgi:hypothetical protein
MKKRKKCRSTPNCIQRKTGTSYIQASCPIRSCSCLTLSALDKRALLWSVGLQLATAIARCFLHARSFRPGEATSNAFWQKAFRPKTTSVLSGQLVIKLTCALEFPSLPVPPTVEQACSSCAAVHFPLEAVIRQFGRQASQRPVCQLQYVHAEPAESRGCSSTAPGNLGKPRSGNPQMTLVYLHLGMLAEILQSCLLVPLTTWYTMQTPSRTARLLSPKRLDQRARIFHSSDGVLAQFHSSLPLPRLSRPS